MGGEVPVPYSVRLPGSQIQLSVHEAGSGPAVVLCPGFPALAYSGRQAVAKKPKRWKPAPRRSGRKPNK